MQPGEPPVPGPQWPGAGPALPVMGQPGSVGAPHAAPPTGPAPAPPQRPSAPTWTLVDVFAGLGATLLLTFVVTAVARIAGYSGGPATVLLGAGPIWVALIGTTVWACRRHGTGNLIEDLGLRLRWSDLLVGIGVGLGLRVAIGIWAIVVARVTGQLPQTNLPSLGAAPLGTGAWIVVNALAIAVLAPVAEEIYFRGLTLRSAVTSLWRASQRQSRVAPPGSIPNRAAWVSGTLFGLLHLGEIGTLTGALVLIPGLVFAGWVMAKLTLWRQRLGPAIVTHATFNATAVVVLLVVG